jgi:hypothetical protein
LQGGKGAQEGVGHGPRQLVEELEHDRIGGLQTGDELVDQARLLANETHLVAGERFEFGQQRRVRSPPPELRPGGAPGAR